MTPNPAQNPATERVDWIDVFGRTLDVLPRAAIRRRNLLHRVTATLVFRTDGRVFVQQRHPGKDVYPGLHDVFVGGTVVSGESFTANACREIGEELGVNGVPVYPLFGHDFADAKTRNRIRVFACVYDGPLTFQPEEVVGGDWCDEDGVARRVAAGELCPDSAQGWRLYLERFGSGRHFPDEIAPGLTPCDCAPHLRD